MLNLDSIRRHFPALDTPWALLDNAGGSATCQHVIDGVVEHMQRRPVQLGASYPMSVEAGAAVQAGRAAAARLFGCAPDEMVLGASSSVLVQQLATMLRRQWKEGDEVIVTNLDHEANVGPWQRLEETGIKVREWKVRPGTLDLHGEDLDALMNERTKLVAFTHCSNIVGTIVDVRGHAARARAAGVLTCVDGVAYAPHRAIDVGALGVDFYFASLYKVYGPHLGAMFGRRDLWLAGEPQCHFFIAPDALPGKHEPGNVNFELTASLVGIERYLCEVAEAHGGRAMMGDAYGPIADHEETLVAPLIEFLDAHPAVRIVGESTADRNRRVPTVSFTVDGRSASEIPRWLDQRSVAVRYGHFYAYRLIRDLGLLDAEGVVRASLVHYNSTEEVSRLIDGLDGLLRGSVA